MTKIITKTANDKAMELVKKYNAIKVHETKEGSTIVETYANTGGESGYDFDVLVVRYKDEEFDSAILYTFKDMDIDKHLVPYEPSTYDFYAWIEKNQDHVDAEAFHHWVGSNSYDEYFFGLYVDYLIDLRNDGILKFTSKLIEPDCKEQTLADKLKEEFAQNKLNRVAFLECVEKMFKEETCGKGAYLRMSHSSFYKQGFSWGGIRTINDPIALYVNVNCMKEAINILEEEGFTLTYMNGNPNVWFIHLC